MREVQDDGTPPKGAYPSSGLPEEETAAPVDPFGPDADAQDLADPFSAADTRPRSRGSRDADGAVVRAGGAVRHGPGPGLPAHPPLPGPRSVAGRHLGLARSR
ncbi:hypothetical protein A5N15_00070 [Rothia kristinae]|uniref:Uncharacterized protein n=1 Tax=Rothia kristinae TaxID=37923 RepID=A0A657IWF0_9MICC|nr:hypothetical protein A5N15_00070 [Rothia kristinae]